MKSLLIAVLGLVAACAHGPSFLRKDAEPVEEMLYRRALHYLDPDNQRGCIDSARVLLDRYIASGVKKEHVREAIVLRRLVGEAEELARVERVLLAALQSQSTEGTEPKRTEPAPAPAPTPRRRETESRPSEQSVKEIQRLRSELREANAELERIRKRLAAPPPGRDSTDTE